MSVDQQCLIWGVPAEVGSGSTPFSRAVNSPRTDGFYAVPNHMFSLTQLQSLSIREKVRLTTWIVDQHRQGDLYPEITPRVINRARSSRDIRFSEQVDRFLLLCSNLGLRPGSYLTISDNSLVSASDNYRVLSWVALANDAELIAFLNILRDEGLIARTGSPQLTAKGFARMEALEATNLNSKRAFVAMWFSTETDAAYANGIEPAIRAAGYTPVRVDRLEHNNKIDDEIMLEIRRSRFAVCDFTSGVIEDRGGRTAVARGGVYFEAGFAAGLGIPVVWTVKREMINLIHFDTRQYAHITWDEPEELRVALFNRIGATIGLALDAPGL